jgi:transcriptional regulator with XRE-family HTH domain
MRITAGARALGRREECKRVEEMLLGFRMARGEARKVGSWIRQTRKMLGVMELELSRRMGCQARAVYRMEQAEMDGTLTLRSLKKAAATMECEVVYAFVPLEGRLVDLCEREGKLRRAVDGDAAREMLLKAVLKALRK